MYAGECVGVWVCMCLHLVYDTLSEPLSLCKLVCVVFLLVEPPISSAHELSWHRPTNERCFLGKFAKFKCVPLNPRDFGRDIADAVQGCKQLRYFKLGTALVSLLDRDLLLATVL